MKKQLPKQGRRGAALILVLIAVAIGLMMVATFLDGRQESVPVADRISAASMARRTAESGLELTVASLVRSDDWRAALADGVFDGSFKIADGICEVRLTDADTHQAPNDSTLRLLVACTAEIDGLAMVAEQAIEVSPSEQPLDIAFGETALIATQRIRIQNDAALLSWVPRSLDTDFMAPLVVGTLDGDANGFELGDAAVSARYEILVADSLQFNAGLNQPGARFLPGPLPDLESPNIPPPVNARRTRFDLELNTTPSRDINAPSIRIKADARISIDGDRILHSRGDLRIEPNAQIDVTRGTLIIDGDGHVTIHRASITAAAGARVLIRGGKSIRITDSTIGPEGASVEALSAEGMLPIETDVTRILMTGDLHSTIMIDGESMVTGVVIAPDTEVRVMDDALVHGRIVADRIDLRDRCIVFAMPDDGSVVGLTSRLGPHRSEDGELVHVVCQPDRLQPSTVLQIATELGVCTIALEEEAEVSSDASNDRRRGWKRQHPWRTRSHRRWRMARGDD